MEPQTQSKTKKKEEARSTTLSDFNYTTKLQYLKLYGIVRKIDTQANGTELKVKK